MIVLKVIGWFLAGLVALYIGYLVAVQIMFRAFL